ncbi:MAG: AraC family transcriptional regulator [Burkholderiales bacterium]|nr:AraC family transcriptional regulator [Burkholderiales bacterium]
MPTDLPGLDDPLHRPDKIAVLVQTLGALGVPPEAALSGSGLAPAALQDAATRVSVRQLLAVHANAQRLAPDPGLALRAGARIRITHFGLYGYALLASPTPQQAIDFAIKYRALASPLIGLAFAAQRDEAVWSFDDVLALGADSALLRFIVELQLGTLLSLHRDLLGSALVPLRASVAYPAPAHAALYREVLGCPVDFQAGANTLCFDAAWLDKPLAFANPITASVVQATCDQLLAEMHSAAGVAGRVAALLLRAPGRFPDIEAVATELGLAVRTLRRRLQAEGRSYQQVLDEVRRQLAQDYLRSTRMSTDDIAAALGFSDAANFRHAFKRWTGHSPGVYRGTAQAAAESAERPS